MLLQCVKKIPLLLLIGIVIGCERHPEVKAPSSAQVDRHVLVPFYNPTDEQSYVASIAPGSSVKFYGPFLGTSSTREDIALIRTKSKSRFVRIDPSSKIVASRFYRALTPFRGKYCAAQQMDGSWIVIDEDDQRISLREFQHIRWLTQITMATVSRAPDIFPVLVDDEWGYADLNGDIVIEPSYMSAYPFSDDFGRVLDKHGRVRYIDRDGRYKLSPGIKNPGDFDMGMAVAQEGAKYGYIDKQGKWAIQPKWQHAFPFIEGYAVVAGDGGDWAIIDKYAEEVVVSSNVIQSGVFDGVALATDSDGRYGVIRVDDNVVLVPFEYEWIDRPVNEFFAATNKEVLAIYRRDGAIVATHDIKALRARAYSEWLDSE